MARAHASLRYLVLSTCLTLCSLSPVATGTEREREGNVLLRAYRGDSGEVRLRASQTCGSGDGSPSASGRAAAGLPFSDTGLIIAAIAAAASLCDCAASGASALRDLAFSCTAKERFHRATFAELGQALSTA